MGSGSLFGNSGRSNRAPADYSVSNNFFGIGPRDNPGYSLPMSPGAIKDPEVAKKYAKLYNVSFKSQEDLLQALGSNNILDPETLQYVRDNAAAAKTQEERDNIFRFLNNTISGNNESDTTLLGLRAKDTLRKKLIDQPGLRSQTLLAPSLKSAPGKFDTTTDSEASA